MGNKWLTQGSAAYVNQNIQYKIYNIKFKMPIVRDVNKTSVKTKTKIYARCQLILSKTTTNNAPG